MQLFQREATPLLFPTATLPETMNKPLKLHRQRSGETLTKSPAATTKKKTNPNPRNPLRDLNLTSYSSSSDACASVPKSRCFNLFPRSKPLHNSPKSLPSKAPSFPSRFIPKSAKHHSKSHLDVPRRKNPDQTPTLTPEKSLIGTPGSNTTPPVQVSISPEIAGGSSVAPTPACFAAGHVIAGVSDRRKCRPRGILTVGENMVSGDGAQVSLVAAPPLAEASMRWLSSPSENGSGFRGDASVSWLLSPLENGISGVCKNASLRNGFVYDDENWSLSPIGTNTAGSPELRGLMGLTPSASKRTGSSGHCMYRTPPSDSSISPFSMILQRAEASSKCKVFSPYQVKAGYRYGTVTENSPFSSESCGSGNVICTPSSDSSLRKEAGNSPFEMDSITEVLGGKHLSPKQVAVEEYINSHLPFTEISFQFGCPSTPSNSIDFSQSQKPSCKKPFAAAKPCVDEKPMLSSELRISWREGLISRVFEMDELDSYRWLSDSEDDYNGEEIAEHKLDHKFDVDKKSPMLTDGNDKQKTEGFGSVEFASDKLSLLKSEAEAAPCGAVSCVESISTDGGGLISSGDSDWTHFYKNHLFEV